MPKALPAQPLEDGYDCTMSSMEPNKSRDATTELDTPSKEKGFKSRCCSRMVNIFVYFRNEFLLRDKILKRFVIDARKKDWFGRHATNRFYKQNLADINYSLFGQYESCGEELRQLSPFHCPGFVILAAKLKTEFLDPRAAFTNAYTNFPKSWQGETDNDDAEENNNDN